VLLVEALVVEAAEAAEAAVVVGAPRLGPATRH